MTDTNIKSARSDECQQHYVTVHERGGVRRVDSIPPLRVTSVQWSRRLSETSDARVDLSQALCAQQRRAIEDLEPRRHEIVLWRGRERVWEGPLVEVERTSSGAGLRANDVTEYIRGTVLSKAWPGPDDGGPTLMTDRIEQIITHELTEPYAMVVGTGSAARSVVVPRWENLDPPANVLPYLTVRPGGVLTRSSTLAFEKMLGEHLDDLAESGVDFVTVGRAITVWDSAQALGRIRTLTEADFIGTPSVYQDGRQYWAISHISAQRDEENPDAGVGNAGSPSDYYGVWTDLHSMSSDDGADTPTQDALNSQAQRRVSGRTSVPVDIVTGGSAAIRLTAGLSINDLVPGVLVPVRAHLGGHAITQTKVLQEIVVTDDPTGESVAISLGGGSSEGEV